MSMSPDPSTMAHRAARSSTYRSTSLQGTTVPARGLSVHSPPFRNRPSPLARTATAAPELSGPSSRTSRSGGCQLQTRLQEEPIRLSVVSTNRQQFGYPAAAIDPSDVRNDLNSQRDRLTYAPVRQAHVRGQHTVRQSGQRLLGRVRMDRAHAAEMTGVERLQQIESFRSSYLSNKDSVGAVAKRCAQQVGNCDWW